VLNLDGQNKKPFAHLRKLVDMAVGGKRSAPQQATVDIQ
jgi:hypothetical protein